MFTKQCPAPLNRRCFPTRPLAACLSATSLLSQPLLYCPSHFFTARIAHTPATLRRSAHRGTSPIRKRHPLGPYTKTMPRDIWWPQGGGRFLMSEVPLYSYERGTPVWLVPPTHPAALQSIHPPSPPLSAARSLAIALTRADALSLFLITLCPLHTHSYTPAAAARFTGVPRPEENSHPPRTPLEA